MTKGIRTWGYAIRPSIGLAVTVDDGYFTFWVYWCDGVYVPVSSPLLCT
jgi:hypothetical protein